MVLAARLFLDHLSVRLQYIEEALAATNFDALVISSGVLLSYFVNNLNAPLDQVPHFCHYCPAAGPYHILKLQSGKKPLLVYYKPKSFWHEQTSLEESFWTDSFDIIETSDFEARWKLIEDKTRRLAYIGNEIEQAAAICADLNPIGLTLFLDWGRSYKTPYEIQCIEDANLTCAKGQIAGRKAFLVGASELEVHYAFLEAVGTLESDLAFPSIVAFNEKAAILHYENKQKLSNGKTLLLDCGVRVLGYASDITRTTTSSHCDHKFKELVADMDKNHMELVDAIAPGMMFSDLHHLSHLKLATILYNHNILNIDPEQAMMLKLTWPFYPHGLGHYLGIQVHDVAGRLSGPDGNLGIVARLYPNLNITRTIEPGQVMTIEPGCYFIPMLLRPFREGSYAKYFNWKLIDELGFLGGIRIEDDILITEKGCRNLTRKYLPI